jgi:hypothetical protein
MLYTKNPESIEKDSLNSSISPQDSQSFSMQLLPVSSREVYWALALPQQNVTNIIPSY